MNEPPAPPVSVIGLGPMGHALAEALLAHGHVTTVWNRSREKADGLVSRGARLAESAAAAVAASAVTLVCLKDYATMYQVLGSSSGAPDGRPWYISARERRARLAPRPTGRRSGGTAMSTAP